jgi:hypothetical protein
VRELDERLGFGKLIAQRLTDPRRGKNTQLPLAASPSTGAPRLYQAASWTTARRVVAKLEFHFGELVSASRIHCDQPGDGQPGGSTFDVPGASLGTAANGINPAGVIAGSYGDGSGFHGFVRIP